MAKSRYFGRKQNANMHTAYKTRSILNVDDDDDGDKRAPKTSQQNYGIAW